MLIWVQERNVLDFAAKRMDVMSLFLKKRLVGTDFILMDWPYTPTGISSILTRIIIVGVHGHK